MVYFKEIRNTVSKFSQQTISGSSWTSIVSFLQGSDPSIIMCMHAQSLQSCPNLCDSMVYRLFSSWGSPVENTGVGYHAILQGIFPTHELNSSLLHLLHCRQILYHGATMESHNFIFINFFFGGVGVLKLVLNQSHQSSGVLNLFALLLISTISLPELFLKHPPLLE